jgi:hypothetical protein
MTKKFKKNIEIKSNELVKPLNKEEIKEKMKYIGTYETHPDNIYKKV